MAVRGDSVSLDVNAVGRSAATLRWTEHDRGATLSIALRGGGGPLETDGLKAELRADAPGGYVRAALPLSGPTCSYTLGDDLTGAPGRGRAYVALMRGEAVVCSTQHFDFEVVRAADLTAGEAEHVQRDFDRLAAEWEAQTERQREEFERSEAARDAGEAAREEAERRRESAEGSRAQAEEACGSAERSRGAAEAARDAAEEARGKAERARAGAEGARLEAESARSAAESARAQAERSRESAEEARSAAESARADAQRANDGAQAKNDADQALNNEAARSMQPHVCGPGEYDAATMRPAVPSPVEGRMYLVPMPQDAAADILSALSGPVDGARPDALSVLASAAAGANAYVEWLSLNGAWEQVGVSQERTVPVSTAEIDAVASGASPKGGSVLTLTGLSYLWAKLKGAFAALSHTHAAAEVEGLAEALGSKADAAHAHGAATAGGAGFMSAEDKGKLDGIAEGATAYADSAAWLAAHPVGTYVVAAAGFDPNEKGGAWEPCELFGAAAWLRAE